jgi:predicted MFS family arabinose efflux permease
MTTQIVSLTLARVRRVPRELILFAIAALAMGAAYSMFDSSFNNYLNDSFTLTPFQRSFLELPRELPGVLVVFVSAGLWFLSSRRLGVVCMLMGVVGAILIGFVSTSYAIMLVWLFIYSMGQHLFMPLSPTIGMELAREGQTGRRLGQLNALRNAATITGGLVVALGFRYLNFQFEHVFILAACGLALAAGMMYLMKPTPANRAKSYLQLHREYRLYYSLSVISGARKQIFITFAPWVLVTIFHQPTQTLATLLMIGGIIGILFQPLLGWAIDRFGERVVLVSEALILIFVCFGYGFARSLLPEGTAFIVVCGCYLIDQMIFSVGMARSTYMKKIALRPDHVQPALTAGVTIDHVFSIAAALVGGLIWNKFGFQYVFLFGMFIAMVNFFVAFQVEVPKPVSRTLAPAD